MKLRRLLAAGLVALLLTACGTGILPGEPGPPSSGPTDPADPREPSGPTDPSGPADPGDPDPGDPDPGDPDPGDPDPGDPDPGPSFGPTATAFLVAVNEARASGATCGTEVMPPAPALTLDARLIRAAEVHSQDMADTKQMRHEGSDGTSAGDRITREGYAWWAWGENVAWGYTSVTSVMQGWLNSPGHCSNIMNANFTQLGAAGVDNYWTQVFARPR